MIGLYFYEGPNKHHLTNAGMALHMATLDALRPIVADYAERGFNAQEISSALYETVTTLKVETILGIVGNPR